MTAPAYSFQLNNYSFHTYSCRCTQRASHLTCYIQQLHTLSMCKGIPYSQLSHRSFTLPIWSSCMTMYLQLHIIIVKYAWPLSVAIQLTNCSLLQLLVFAAYTAIPSYILLHMPTLASYIAIVYHPYCYCYSLPIVQYGYLASLQCCLVFCTQLLYYAYLVFIIAASSYMLLSLHGLLSLHNLLMQLAYGIFCSTYLQLYTLYGLHCHPLCYA